MYVDYGVLLIKFIVGIREVSLSRSSSLSHTKSKLTATRPKTHELITSQLIRPVRIISSAELEEELMAKIPKFKAHRINKKTLEAPALQRSTHHTPEFKEFHLETMSRANQNQWKHHLTAPKSPSSDISSCSSS
ncbi:hypothetical protein RD792_015849 [Penstemon davidsonii]|uniref:TPX2 central domain-containing protein n=1 Tax=Penstemon davidsonii TaxID=160366 RepID=A0ABR0CHR7_9LAMI|nr:hypothetical protein RD792_015849 [Penstemon davidsonii]